MDTCNINCNFLSSPISKELHSFIQAQNKEMLNEIENFITIQNEFMEFRLFASLNADKIEMEKIANKIRENRANLWGGLLEKNKGDVSKAMDYFYE